MDAPGSSDVPPPGGIPRRDTDPEITPFVDSQAHLLHATENNPLPTAVPPPISANAGTLGVRHVLCVIGLPERGKPYIAKRLQAYLSFFHGAEVQVFNLTDYERGPTGCDENADALLEDMRKFMSKQNAAAASNMSVAKAQNGGDAEEALVDEKDKRRKNVDSGKVAIIMSTDSHRSFKEKWSGTSKERRQWAATTLALDRRMNAKLIFIEVIVNQPALIEANIRAKRRALGQGDTSPVDLREHNHKVKTYSRMYVTLQDDGSEDDLSYIKLYNYGGKVVTNRMHGYLRMRIAQFLTTVHTTPHIIYLSRHGQSEYNVLGKIGGNPPLAEPGKKYAENLGKWVPQNVAMTPEGRPIKSRLWTSSLQRTILTAEHIPHPLIPMHEFTQEFQERQSVEVSDAAAPGGGLPGGGSPSSGAVHCSRALASGSVSAAPSPKRDGLDGPPPRARELFEPVAVGGATPPPEMPPELSLPETNGAAAGFVSRTNSYQDELRRSGVQSGSSPPPELLDADVDGVWEQMSPRVYRNLDEIFAGEYEGMRYEDIKRLRPDEASLRSMDKIGYRYPRGESYFDILARLDPLVHEMESYHEPLLIVSHQAVLRVLYAYLLGKNRATAPKIEIPLHTVMKITYDGWNEPSEERFYLGPEPFAIVPDTGDARPADGQPKDYDGQSNGF